MNVLALCAGVGGLELGLRLATSGSARTICYVEREAYAASVLVARMGDGTMDTAPVWSDVSTFDGRRWRGLVDLATAGYPCQPFSSAGARRGVDDPRHLWPYIVRIIGQCRPQYVFCENVAAHLQLGFDTVVADMEGLDYRVAATLHTAAEHGARHKRERLFWLACDTHREGQHAVAVDGQMGGQPGRDGVTWTGWQSWSSFRGVADGVACRVDRLRAIGNGVVPVVATAAYLELMDALHGVQAMGTGRE